VASDPVCTCTECGKCDQHHRHRRDHEHGKYELPSESQAGEETQYVLHEVDTIRDAAPSIRRSLRSGQELACLPTALPLS
jgi:hypothetical protein